ncbi:MAG: phosphomannomutase/phosphoglucomutase [Phycisphaerae bacterium]|nr:phosphomannomutase/phosphoglucomutase [Phycisphaerae bacterium]NIX31788.1 phosphomannomutase [Phycisphaerae bacterium]
MRQEIFREFSIRGQAERDLTDPVVYQIGQAIGAYLADMKPVTLVVGHDVRWSSPRICQTVAAGLTVTGVNVVDIGLVPTPILNFAVDHFHATGGVMVTASHNPPGDNGFKLRTNVTLTGPALQQIYALAIAQAFPQGQGVRAQKDGLTPYLEALRKRALSGRAQKIVVDGGNGINGRIVSDFLRGQGHTVTEVFTELDGTFPNRNPDPTAPKALLVAAQTVIEHQADFGLAYDGDGDRVVLIDELGQPHYGDIILMLLARNALREKPVHVVYDVSCTKALADDVVAHGGQAHPAAVGYAFVHEKMRELGATLGGETAGHIFCLDDTFKFDDAILASIKLINYFAGQNQPVSALIADLPKYHTTPNLRLFCPDTLKQHLVETITRHYQATHPVETIDGAKIMFDGGWALVRPSNTQPAISLRAEGETFEIMTAIKNEVLNLVQVELAKLGVSTEDDLPE